MELQMGLTLTVIATLLVVSANAGSDFKALENQTYTIDKTWDNQTTSDNSSISISFSIKCDPNEVTSLFIEIDAPFYDDPKGPVNASTSIPFPGLWDYEVVEAFFLGNDDEYLEIELAPSGHYLLLYLNGYRNVTNQTLPLTTYSTHFMNSTDNSTLPRWQGQGFIPLTYFPMNVTRFNAYAIHNSDPNRVYMSLFPVDSIKYPNRTEPDFHFLEGFGSFDYGADLNSTLGCSAANKSGSGRATMGMNLFGWLISLMIVTSFWHNYV